ncbi:MAG: DUF934 domain-containing protein [Roseiarcus sp.]
MALWREGGFVDDIWTHVADAADMPRAGGAIVSFVRWRLERESLAKRAGPVGVEIAAGAEALEHLRDAADRPLVALRFDKFADGRAFSYAILLRQRHGFSGELRAVGDVLIDEIPLMLRCGFDSFEVVNAPTLRGLQEGGAPKFPLAYQPSAVRREGAAGHRPWARQVG